MKKLKTWTLKWSKAFAFFLFLLIPGIVWSQNQNLPLNHQFHHDFERKAIQSDAVFHSSFKPILQRKAAELVKSDSALSPHLYIEKKGERSFVARKLFYEHLIFLDSNNIQLSIDPILNLEVGDELRDEGRSDSKRYYKNTRGFIARLNIGNQLSVSSSFRENQAVLPFYLSQRIAETKVAYGQGRVKNFGDHGYDFAMASATVSYSPAERLNLQLGHGKHFVGEGYRSFLLSDLTFNYPYFRIQSDWLNGKLNYQNMFALFQDISRLDNSGLNEGVFERKQGVFHFVNYSPTANFSFGVFEGFIYPSLDTSGNISVPASYWIPLIGFNSVSNASGEKGNTTLGVNLKWELFRKLKLYGQLSFFDEQIKQYKYQAGGKLFLGKPWTIQLEYNQGVDQHLGIYHHYNESLTHPAFGDFQEIVAGIYLHQERWMSRLIFNHLEMNHQKVNYLDFRQSYVINPSYNFTVSAGLQYRKAENIQLDDDNIGAHPNSKIIVNNGSPPLGIENSLYLYISVSTNLQNTYFNY